jgi:hypothetical protein
MDSDKVRFRGVGYAFTATAGATTNGDYKLTANRIIDGTQIIVKNHVHGDKVTFQVVDVDNMLGYGAGVVLDDFGVDWYLAEDQMDQQPIRMFYSAEVFSGLYIRVKYVSVGATNVEVKVNLFMHLYNV